MNHFIDCVGLYRRVDQFFDKFPFKILSSSVSSHTDETTAVMLACL